MKTKSAPLASNFVPGEYDVICYRGSNAYNHIGNRNLRQLVDENLELYTQAFTRAEKSMLIVSIVKYIREKSPNGGFVRFCKKSKCYVEIGDDKAREKVGHSFRDAISAGRRATKSMDRDAGGVDAGVASWCPLKIQEATGKPISKTPMAVGKVCDDDIKPLSYTSAPQRMSLLMNFAAELECDEGEASSKNFSALDVDSAEFREILADGDAEMKSILEDLRLSEYVSLSSSSDH